MSHIFISYARKDIDFADKIVQALAKKEQDTWIDWKSIHPAEDWWKEIERGIEQADAFLFLISPDSVASQTCSKEIAHAVKNSKRILPVVILDADQKIIHPEISKRNWIFCRDGQDDFEKAVEETCRTIRIDYEWCKYHTQLQNKGLAWEQRKDHSRLLRGKELQEAEDELSRAGQKDPLPTDLQRQYLLESRRSEGRRRNILQGIGAMVIVALIFLAVFAKTQQNIADENALTAIANQNAAQTAQANAEEQAKIARSGELAAAAISNLDTDPERSILLARRAITEIDARGPALPEAVDALQRALHTSRVQRIIRIYEDKGNSAQNENSSADNWVNDVAFSPDGDFIAVARTDGKAQVWDMNSTLFQQFPGHTGWVHTVAFSPDGTLLATAGYDKTVRIWDVATGETLKILSGHTNEINNVTFSPDGSKIATASWDGTATIWDVASKQPLHTIRPNREEPVQVMDVAFSVDGAQLALAMDDGTASIWDTETGAESTKLLGGHAAGINSVAFSPDPKGEKLATASDDKTVKVWDTVSGGEILVITGHFESVRSVMFSSDGMYLITGSIDGTVKMWDPNTGKSLITFVGHSNSVDSISYTANQERLASASRDGTVRIWNAAIGHTSSVNSVVFSPDGQYFATASDDKTAKLWDSNSGQELHTFAESQGQQTHEGRVTDVAFSPDGSRLATTGDDGAIKIWDVKTRTLLLSLVKKLSDSGNKKVDADTVLAFSPDGKSLASAGSEGIIKIWDANTGESLSEWEGHTRPISGILFTEDGKSLITSSLDKATRIWDVGTKQKLENFTNGLMRDVSISPNGKWIVTADDDGQVKLWSLSDTLLEILMEHDNKVFDVDFDSNGTSLATASWDKTSRLWFSEDGNLTEGVVRWIFYNTTEVYGVAFSPDGKRLVIGTVDGQVNVYLLDVNELREYAITRVSRSFTEDECNQYFPGQECPSTP